jgi:hypothetical protein
VTEPAVTSAEATVTATEGEAGETATAMVTFVIPAAGPANDRG